MSKKVIKPIVLIVVFIAALIIDHFPRRLFGSALLIIIAVLGYIYSIQTTEWAILIYGLVMIFFLYMYVCFASAVYIPELWPTHLRLRGSGFVNAVGRIVAALWRCGIINTLWVDYGVYGAWCHVSALCAGSLHFWHRNAEGVAGRDF